MATQALVKDAGPSGQTAGPVDVIPLLRSYRRALLLARSPPASLALPRKLTWLHMRLRPSWGCNYFTARYIRRRTDSLERALTGRMAVGEADENDAQELEALRGVKSSLPPPPPRIFTVVGLIAAILLSQALLGWLLGMESSGNPADDSEVQRAFEGVSLSPDVKSLGDIGRALASANYVENGVVLLTIFLVLYLFVRPLACGYRLSLMCLGQPDRLSRPRRRSDLWKAAEALDIPRKETALARAMHAELRRDAPIDLLVKSLPWLAVAYWMIGLTRFQGEPHVTPSSFAIWLAVVACSVAATAFVTKRMGSGRRHLAVGVQLAVLAAAFALIVRFNPGHSYFGSADLLWLGVGALCVTRLGWLTRRLPARSASSSWIGLPVIFTCVIALILPGFESIGIDVARRYAREAAGISEVPRQSRSDLQLLLQEHHNLAGVDLRGQDLHRLSLRGKRLVDARLRLADIRRADLHAAELRRADLTGVIAKGAIFERADLRGATLRCSDLRDANFSHARLEDANFTGAVVSPRTRWPAGFSPRGAKRAHVLDSDYARGLAASYDHVMWACFF